MESTITISLEEYESLKYDSITLHSFYEENKILKKELYSIIERVEVVEKYRQEIQTILQNNTWNTHEKITQIESVTI